ncbi:hypothetical protein RFI_29826 [Reticulomyxa filosa]|uniref:Uncharacterized protein n=1 Tax=Reticulomyxa filosa TaxID=46433 RepID=X6M3G6_RETFI|nr:hypothetical protein RFI_29826 [Reticulomyxa filosa]|eukprot:ETO07565.1 hypothetical protein RFI_29826 [Reticulomyxa filosa]
MPEVDCDIIMPEVDRDTVMPETYVDVNMTEIDMDANMAEADSDAHIQVNNIYPSIQEINCYVDMNEPVKDVIMYEKEIIDNDIEMQEIDCDVGIKDIEVKYVDIVGKEEISPDVKMMETSQMITYCAISQRRHQLPKGQCFTPQSHYQAQITSQLQCM